MKNATSRRLMICASMISSAALFNACAPSPAAKETAGSSKSTGNKTNTGNNTSNSSNNTSAGNNNNSGNNTDNSNSGGSSNSSSLTGAWSLCGPFQNGGNIRSQRIEFDFQSTGSFTQKMSFFSDSSCSTSASASDINGFVQLVKKDAESQGAAWNSDYENWARSMVTNYTASHQYKVGNSLGNNIYELDVRYQGESNTHYLAYKISSSGLQMTYACLQENIDAKDCTNLSGNSASNRATTEFNNPIPKA